MGDELPVAEAGEALLLSVLPLFTSTLSQTASVKSSYFENFCTLFAVEAQLLETWLIEQDTKIDKTSEFYLEILDNIIALFESLVGSELSASPKNTIHFRIRESKYTKLPILRQCIKSANDAGISLLGLRDLLYFGHSQADFRKNLWVLTTFNNNLSGAEENLPTWWSQENLHKRSPAYEVRESAATLYQALLDKWPACEKTSHEALLCLSRHQNAEESKAEFDLLFSTHNQRWQDTKIAVFIQEKPRAPSRVRFADPPLKKRAVPQQLAKDICGLIENTSKRKVSLHMILDGERKLWHTLPTLARKAPALDLCDSISMRSIIKNLQEERLQGSEFRGSSILSLKQRRVIAVILAHSLLQFCGSAWLREDWDKGSISFVRYAEGDRIVLSTGLRTRDIAPDLDAPYRFHQYPGVLALAILLLEIELKKTSETAKGEQDDLVTEDGELDPNANLEIAAKMFNDIQDNVLPDFKSAIEACLSFHYHKEDTEIDDLIYHRDKLYDDIGLRRKIYAEIVAPLEQELCISFPEVKLDDLRDTPLSFPFWGRIDLAPRASAKSQNANQHQMPQKTVHTNVPLKEAHQIKSILSDFTPEPNSQSHYTQPIFFHDVPLSLSNDSRKASKTWFDNYTAALDGLIDRIEYSLETDAPRIKIAMLDTGIDWNDPYILGASDRIQGWMNWADDRQEADERKKVHDAFGHGTHVAALLLKTSPESVLYVGRVADANGCTITPEKIAEAIRYSTDVWGVDIITMSFGFRTSIPIIDQAIKHAFSENVIMFAAASNTGGNEGIAFPAMAHQMVIGINSTDAWGNKSNFTPTSLPYSENFSTLGEAVESSWPKHLGKGSTQWRSGTSYATPIAAGIAATMLFYTRMKLQKLDRVAELKTCSGMRRLLLSMADMRDGYNYLCPWVLWRKDDEYIRAHIRVTLG